MTEPAPTPPSEVKPKPRYESAAALVVNLLGLAFVHLHDEWRPALGGVVTERFGETLWAITLAAVTQIAGNTALLAAPAAPWRRHVELAFALTGLVSAVVTMQVFPFDLARFGSLVPLLARILLGVGIFAMLAACFAAMVRLWATDDEVEPPAS
jgi:hypothetical protein